MKKKQFLHYPEFPGGKATLNKYIADNQVYPEDAQKNNIEGIVYLSADVNDNGQVTDIRIEKGIGYGCDEEALRLLQGMHFGSVFNRGLRLKTRKKFRIPFRLKPDNSNVGIQYVFKKSEPVVEKKSVRVSKEQPYFYSIQWPNPGAETDHSDRPD
jgi:TonB family protein